MQHRADIAGLGAGHGSGLGRRRPLRVIAGAAGLGVCFVIAARMLVPQGLVAEPIEPPRGGAAADRGAQVPGQPGGWVYMGELAGRRYRVRVYSAPDGLLYTVRSAGGELLGEDLVAEEVHDLFPDLDVHLHADGEAPTAVMMVDPSH